jgi:hypothetical protein
VEAVSKIYSGPSNPRTGEPIFPGFERGSELGWSPGPVGLAADYFRFIVFKDSNWDPKALNFDSHYALVSSRADFRPLDAPKTDLTPFVSRGGLRFVVYRKGASGEDAPLRMLQGSRTRLADPHGIAFDSKRQLLFVTNHGSTHDNDVSAADYLSAAEKEERSKLKNWPLDRDFAVPGSSARQLVKCFAARRRGLTASDECASFVGRGGKSCRRTTGRSGC